MTRHVLGGLLVSAAWIAGSLLWVPPAAAQEPVGQHPRWVQCAQHCSTFQSTQCVCLIAATGTECWIKLSGPGSCVGSECFSSSEGTSLWGCDGGTIFEF